MLFVTHWSFTSSIVEHLAVLKVIMKVTRNFKEWKVTLDSRCGCFFFDGQICFYSLWINWQKLEGIYKGLELWKQKRYLKYLPFLSFTFFICICGSNNTDLLWLLWGVNEIKIKHSAWYADTSAQCSLSYVGGWGMEIPWA